MQTMRNLLSRTPVSTDEVLDLFQAYVSTIGDPLVKAVNMITDELDYRSGDIFSNIIGVVDDANEMAKRVKQIRAARNAGTDVTITLTEIEHRQLDTAIPDMIDLLGDTASTLELLSGGFDTGRIDADQPAIAATLRLLVRSLRSAQEIEVAALEMADGKIRKAVSEIRETQRKVTPQVGEAV